MNNHLKQVEALLGLSLSGLTEERAALVNQLAGDIWDMIREQAEKHELDTREMYAVSLTTHFALTEIVLNEIE